MLGFLGRPVDAGLAIVAIVFVLAGGLLAGIGLAAPSIALLLLSLVFAAYGIVLLFSGSIPSTRRPVGVPTIKLIDVQASINGADEDTVGLLYDQAKARVEDQVKRIESFTTRATWLATMSGALLAIVGTQAKNLSDLRPNAAGALGLIVGITLVIGAVLAGFRAAMPTPYGLGQNIRASFEAYAAWPATAAKAMSIANLGHIYETNEARLDQRVCILTSALLGLTVGVVLLTAVLVGIVGGKLGLLPCWFLIQC